jgi:hypothetical protein
VSEQRDWLSGSSENLKLIPFLPFYGWFFGHLFELMFNLLTFLEDVRYQLNSSDSDHSHFVKVFPKMTSCIWQRRIVLTECGKSFAELRDDAKYRHRWKLKTMLQWSMAVK